MGGQTNAINSSGQTNGKKATVSFPRLFLSHPHLLRSVTAGFSQSLAWLGWDAPSLPDAVGGSGREVIVFFFLVASSSGSTSVDDDSDDGRAAGKRREETTLLASGFDRRRQKGVARDATRRESAGGASEVVLGRKKEGGGRFVFFPFELFDSSRGSWRSPVVNFSSFFCNSLDSRLSESQGARKGLSRRAPVHNSQLSPFLFRARVRTSTCARQRAPLPRCASRRALEKRAVKKRTRISMGGASQRRGVPSLLAFFLLVAALFCSSLLAVDARRHRQLSR